MSRSSAAHCSLHIHKLAPINLNKQSKMSKICISLSLLADFSFLCPPHHIYILLCLSGKGAWISDRAISIITL